MGGTTEVFPMDKEVKLVKKIKRLLKRANIPRWHYAQRIDRLQPVRRPLKLSMAVDTRRKRNKVFI